MKTLSIEPLSPEEFDLLEFDWNDLLSRSRSDTVFLRWEWMHTWWAIFKGDRTLLILAARREGRVMGIAPFYIQIEGLLRLRSLRLCSDELAPDYLDLIVEKGREGEVVEAFLNYLRDHAGLWDTMSLQHVLPGSILLTDQLLLKNTPAAVTLAHICPYVELKGAFEDYYRQVPGGTEWSRKQRVLFDKKSVVHKVVQAEGELAEAMAYLFTLHEKRKKDQGLITTFILPDVRRFHQEVSGVFLKNKILDLQMLCHDDTPIGVHYGFHYKNKAYIFNSGFDPEWGRSSLGAILLRMTIQQAFEKGYEEYDFLKGDEDYKGLWANAFRREIEVTAYSRTVHGGFWRSVDNGRSALKTLRRSLRTLSPAASR